MSERRGNRYYPNPGLSSQGTLAPAIARLEQVFNLHKIRRPLQKRELQGALQLVDLLAFKDDWDRIAELSSRVILAGCGTNAQVRFYRTWIEALRGNHDLGGLQSLGKHLLGKRHSSANFTALSLMALSYAGRIDFAKIIFRNLKKTTGKNELMLEACGTYLCESLSVKARSKGINLLAKLASAKHALYFLRKNYLGYSLENNALDQAQIAFDQLHTSFPQCPQAYWAAAVLAISNEQWGEGATALQELLADNPENGDAVLALVRCFEKTGDLLAARDLLTTNSILFDLNDYEFNVASGMINKKLFERYTMESYRKSAVRHLANAMRVAPKLKIPEAPLHLALRALNAGVGEQQFESKTASLGSPKAWILSVDSNSLKGILHAKDFVARAPQGLSQGDVVFVSRRFDAQTAPHQEHVIGLLTATSPVVPDCHYGKAVQLSGFKAFENPVDVTTQHGEVNASDFFGLENFSKTGVAVFVGILNSTAEAIVSQVENQNQEPIVNERVRYAG